MLDPLILMGYQALNPERDVPSSEWFGLLVLQQEHGRDALLTWQKLAAGPRRTTLAPPPTLDSPGMPWRASRVREPRPRAATRWDRAAERGGDPLSRKP